nr:unnamed protein product [Callosobruchus analis]
MYNLFCSKYPDVTVSYYCYRQFFHENFNLHFGRPQVDTCTKCEELTLKIKSSTLGDAAKKAAVAQKMVHERSSKKFYTYLKTSSSEYRQRNDLGVICFDCMQNLQLPLIPVQDVFYPTQLTVSLFCIHDMRSGKSYFYTHPVENGRFRKIEQIFPIRGHSFLPCDRDFAVIKRNLKKYDRLYDLHEYTEIIVASGLKNKFTVHEIHAANNTDILDFKSWWPTYYKKTVYLKNRSSRLGIQE